MTAANPKTLLLIDANSIIHRSFHALPPLTSKDGRPAQALYGISSIFIKLWKSERPDYAAALFDRPEPTFRKEKYPEYKATRPKAADELIEQIVSAHDLFPKFGIPVFEKPGYEADDLIATLAKRFGDEKDLRVVILTGDLDTLQLVRDEHILVRVFKQGISNTVTYDEKAVHDRYGLRPDQLADYKALVGDTSDNVKGVNGVGPKTAVTLLQKYKNLAGIFEGIEKDPKMQAKFGAFREEAKFSHDLVVLEGNADIGLVNLDDVEIRFNEDDLKAYFTSLGFESLVKRLSSASEEEKKPKKKAELPESRKTEKPNQGMMF